MIVNSNDDNSQKLMPMNSWRLRALFIDFNYTNVNGNEYRFVGNGHNGHAL